MKWTFSDVLRLGHLLENLKLGLEKLMNLFKLRLIQMGTTINVGGHLKMKRALLRQAKPRLFTLKTKQTLRGVGSRGKN